MLDGRKYEIFLEILLDNYEQISSVTNYFGTVTN